MSCCYSYVVLGFLLEKTELFTNVSTGFAQCKSCKVSTIPQTSDGRIRKFCELCGKELKNSFVTKFSDEIIKLADRYKKNPR